MELPHFTLLLLKMESGYFVYILFLYLLLLQNSSSIKIIKWPTGVLCLQHKQLATPEPWTVHPPPPPPSESKDPLPWLLVTCPQWHSPHKLPEQSELLPSTAATTDVAWGSLHLHHAVRTTSAHPRAGVTQAHTHTLCFIVEDKAPLVSVLPVSQGASLENEALPLSF